MTPENLKTLRDMIDAAIEHGPENVEWRSRYVEDTSDWDCFFWQQLNEEQPRLDKDWELNWRIKPKTRRMGRFPSVEVPMGTDVEPDYQETCYSITSAGYVYEFEYQGEQEDVNVFKRGLVYLSESDAQQVAKQMWLKEVE